MNYVNPKKIFIVDDDTMLCEALSDQLTRNAPHEIYIFNTGEDCLKNIKIKPDIVILDYYLNTEKVDAADGIEILKAIKGIYPGIHVIMLSSQESYGIAMQTIQKGAEDYIIKDENAFKKIADIVNSI